MINKTFSKKNVAITVFIAISVALTVWAVWSNTALESNTYVISSDRLPKEFSGFRIAHISDLHNAEMGAGNEKLLELLKASKPDIIAITGDLVDSRRTDVGVALNFASRAVDIAPCYYVSGNHEARISEYEELKDGLEDVGVTILENEAVELERDGRSIRLLGVSDPSFETDYLFGDSASVVRSVLQAFEDEGNFTALLSHRPELFETYAESDVDLALCGHSHGGQFRLPFFGGLVAPNQGLFPKYDAGLFNKGNTYMIVSRGIGNSIIPFRFNNRPEIILVELKSAE